MNAIHQSILATATGAALPLIGLKIDGHLRDSFAYLELTQTYRNSEPGNIEAIYTFPLPVEAVLLRLSVALNGKTLQGRVTERARAEAEYEEAITDGDSGILLEQVEPGLYTMNVGNLLSGDEAEIRLRYALPLRWDGDRLRLSLATTLAPRYGDASAAAVAPHQDPETNLLVEHAYALSLTVLGALSEAEITSPSHRIAKKPIEEGIEITLVDQKAFADRDFVLILKAPAAAQSALTVTGDGEETTGHAVFRIPERAADQPIALKILVDCSGSMAGDSMALAKAGALHALQQLKAGDQFSLTAFGSTCNHFAGKLSAAGTRKTRALAEQYAHQLNANLGGTEMRAALDAVFALPGSTEGADILLITDGETWDRRAIVQAARQSRHRIFVIGVGSSPSEVLVREIAEATGGTGIFVSPDEDEDIRPLIERQLSRMRVPRVVSATVSMPGDMLWQSPRQLEGAVFAGDTLHVFAGFKQKFDGPAQVNVAFADGTVVNVIAASAHSKAAGSPADAELPRLAAATRLREAVFLGAEDREAELTALAVFHQLISPYTHYVLIHERGAEAANGLPQLRKVPQMLAAGWGGVGSVQMARPHAVASPPAPYAVHARDARSVNRVGKITACMRTLLSQSPRVFIESLNRDFGLFHPGAHPATTLDGLVGLPRDSLDPSVTDGLRHLIAGGWPDEEVVIAFWLALLHSPVGHHFSRGHRRAILRAAREVAPAAALVQWLTATVLATTDAAWSWTPVSAAPVAVPVSPCEISDAS